MRGRPDPGQEVSASRVAEGTSPSDGLVEADGGQVLLAQRGGVDSSFGSYRNGTGAGGGS